MNMTVSGNDVDTSLSQLQDRADFRLIEELVEPGTRVLDVGCSDGSLLRLLADRRGVDGRGIELSQEGVNLAVAHGLSVIQGDADSDLADYPADAFDYVILSQTIQATRRPDAVLKHMLRIGRNAIVSFPNFGHWRVRLQLALQGRMPVTQKLHYRWYDTPNIHFCTIKDFATLCAAHNFKVERLVVFDSAGKRMGPRSSLSYLNFRGEQAVFLLTR